MIAAELVALLYRRYQSVGRGEAFSLAGQFDGAVMCRNTYGWCLWPVNISMCQRIADGLGGRLIYRRGVHMSPSK